MFFYVHTTQVLALSTNHFDNLVPPKPSNSTLHDDLGPVVPLPESASVLNIVFHIIYDISCTHYHPAIDTLIAATDIMPKYGLPPQQHLAPSTPLYALILSLAPMQPIAVYALAARRLLDLEPVGALYQPLGAEDLRPRGALRDDADPDLPSPSADRLAPEEFELLLTEAVEAAVTAARQARDGALAPQPDRCAYGGGCAYPTICRCEA